MRRDTESGVCSLTLMMPGSSKRGGGGPGGSYTMSPVLRTWNCIRSTLSTSAVVSACTGTLQRLHSVSESYYYGFLRLL